MYSHNSELAEVPVLKVDDLESLNSGTVSWFSVEESLPLSLTILGLYKRSFGR